MPQQFGDAHFNGNVRIKGRLQLDHPLPMPSSTTCAIPTVPAHITDQLASIEARLQNASPPPEYANLHEEIQSQQAALNTLQREVGALVASMHTARDQNHESPTLMSALKAQQQEFQQQQHTLREQQREVTKQHETLKQRLEEQQPSFATTDSMRAMEGEIQALRQQMHRLEQSSSTATEPKRNVSDTRHSMQSLHTTEAMIQTYIADLRNEFVFAQREMDFAGVQAALNDTFTNFQTATNDRLLQFDKSVALCKDETATATERVETTRRQIATLSSEVDSLRQVLRGQSTSGGG